MIKTTLTNRIIYKLECKDCGYQVVDDREWFIKVKCGAHKRYKNHRNSIISMISK